MTRTALGVVALKGASLPASTVWTPLTSKTLATGDTLLVFVATNNLGVTVTVTWNGMNVPVELTYTTQGALAASKVYALHNVTGGTGDIVLTSGSSNWSSASSAGVIAVGLAGLASSPLDQTALGNGSGTAPDTADTATTTQADEFLIGFHAFQGNTGDDTGSPAAGGDTGTEGQSASTSGGSATTNIIVQESYATVSATGAYDHSWSGYGTSRNWNAGILTYKIAPAVAAAWLPARTSPSTVANLRR